MLRGGREAEHAEPQDAPQLRDREPDASRRGVDQDRFAALHRGHAHQHVVGREVHDGEGGALLEGPTRRERKHRGRRGDDQLALTPELRRRDDQVPGAERCDAVADSVDRAGDFVADGARRFRRVGV